MMDPLSKISTFSLAASQMDIKDLATYAYAQRDSFNIHFATLIFATLALSYQFSRPKTKWPKLSLYSSWIILFIAGMLAGNRLYTTAELARLQIDVSFSSREFSRLYEESKIPDEELLSGSPRVEVFNKLTESHLKRSAQSFQKLTEINDNDVSSFRIQCILFVIGIFLLALSSALETLISERTTTCSKKSQIPNFPKSLNKR